MNYIRSRVKLDKIVRNFKPLAKEVVPSVPILLLLKLEYRHKNTKK